MKTFSTIGKTAIRFLGLLAVGCALMQGQAHAAQIRLETQVPGYTGRGDGWVLVLPELRSVLGGKVRWDNARNCYVTDRVARGEVMKITISPSTPSERCTRIALTGIAPGPDWHFDSVVFLPYTINNFKVSNNPSYDNVYVNVATTSGWFDKRLPIGSR